jgi:carbonic anhydrase
MLTRRAFCGCALLAGVASRPAHAADECAVFTRARQKAVDPQEAIALLKSGNDRFVSGRTINCDLMAQVKETAKSQAPFAVVIGCIDSRVPPELVFDQRIGDIFCARVAGNFVNTDIIGSVEFATKITGARAVVVLGHSECGAVKGAIDNVKMGNLTATLSKIRPAVSATKSTGDRSSKNAAFVQQVADMNVKLAAQALTARSSILKELVDAKQLVILPAMHDLATGRVTFSSDGWDKAGHEGRKRT